MIENTTVFRKFNQKFYNKNGNMGFYIYPLLNSQLNLKVKV